MLSHRSAAEQWQMMPEGDGPVHITVPYGHSATSTGFVVVHRSRAHAHIWYPSQPPRTTKPDTVLDLAMAADTAEHAADLLVSMSNRCGIATSVLMGRIADRRPARHAKALDHAVTMLAGGVQSALELRFADAVESAHDLPSAQRQTPVSVDGQTLYEDATYDHVGVPLTVRLDGRAFHSTPHVAFRDRRRDNVAELSARSRLVYGWHDVHQDPCAVAREVATVLRRHGWAGSIRACSRCSTAVSA
jgi:hypothetical protein